MSTNITSTNLQTVFPRFLSGLGINCLSDFRSCLPQLPINRCSALGFANFGLELTTVPLAWLGQVPLSRAAYVAGLVGRWFESHYCLPPTTELANNGTQALSTLANGLLLTPPGPNEHRLATKIVENVYTTQIFVNGNIFQKIDVDAQDLLNVHSTMSTIQHTANGIREYILDLERILNSIDFLPERLNGLLFLKEHLSKSRSQMEQLKEYVTGDLSEFGQSDIDKINELLATLRRLIEDFKTNFLSLLPESDSIPTEIRNMLTHIQTNFDKQFKAQRSCRAELAINQNFNYNLQNNGPSILAKVSRIGSFVLKGLFGIVSLGTTLENQRLTNRRYAEQTSCSDGSNTCSQPV